MNYADLSILVIALLFALSFVPRAHLGLAAFPAAFLVGSVADISVQDLVSFFPSNFFILIVGVMSVFSIVQSTGAMAWVLDSVLALVRGRVALLPLVPFVLGALLSAVGTLPLAAVAIMAPIAMGLARRHNLPAFLLAFTMLNGVLSGLFSPIAVFGITVDGLIAKLNIEISGTSTQLAVIAFLIGTLLTAIMMFAYRKSLKVSVHAATTTSSVDSSDFRDVPQSAETGTARLQRIAALVGLAVMVLGGVIFELDLGFLGFTVAFVLMLTLRIEPTDIISRIPWGVVILIGGLLTYVGVMEHLDAFKRLSDLLMVDGSPMISLLVLCYIAALTSFFANSIAVIISTLPLLPPIIAQGVSPVGAVIAVMLSAVLVDLNPLGATGGLVLGATAQADRQRLFRQLLTYGLSAVVIAPGVTWLVFGSLM